MASTSDWLHFHQSSASAPGQGTTPYSATSASELFFSGRTPEPTVVSNSMGPINDQSPTGSAQLGPNTNRVSKPARKRTRASRRTPTTLLNTDTTNFRAMVQQFTGGPSSNFDIPGPSPQMYGNGLGRGLQLPVGQLQQQVLGSLQYSMSSNVNNNNSNNSNNNIMFMQQRMGDNNNNDHQSFTTNDHNINVNMRLSGTGGGSSSSDNRSIDNFHF